ncbi:MAG: hypothetical protein ABL984_08765 [Pyrinomonadaceae bacterium]
MKISQNRRPDTGFSFSQIGFRRSKLPANTPPARYRQQMDYVTTLIHELVHRGLSSEGHGKFARAAYNALSSEEQKSVGTPQGNDTARSNYFSSIVNSKCKFDPEDANEIKNNLVP